MNLVMKMTTLARKLVSQAAPFPFCSADRFQYWHGGGRRSALRNGMGLARETTRKYANTGNLLSYELAFSTGRAHGVGHCLCTAV